MEGIRKKLKIAMIAPLAERVPPEKYGGTERVVHTLTEELVARGHDVTLFASGDSITSAKLISVAPKSLRKLRIHDPYGLNELTTLNIGLAYDMQEEFDIIHDHLGNFSMPAANVSKTPVMLTIHGVIDENCSRLLTTLTGPYVVTISNSQIKNAPKINHIGTVYNGLNMDKYPFSQNHDGYLLYVGRISMQKGVHIAIEIAQKLKILLIIAAKLDDVEKPYFEKFIKSKLTGGYVKLIGEIDEKKRNKLMSRAMAALHPITWEEPFGLALIESMACGCPVIAFDRGSIPEVIKNCYSGFIVKNIREMSAAVLNLPKIVRENCRKHAIQNFNAKKMIDAYELLYEEVIERHKARTEKDRIIPQILPQNKLQLTVSNIKSEIL